MKFNVTNQVNISVSIVLDINHEAIDFVQNWAFVYFVKFTVNGQTHYRFVSKKRVAEVEKANTVAAEGRAVRVKSVDRISAKYFVLAVVEKTGRGLFSDVVINIYRLTRYEASNIYGRLVEKMIYNATIA